MIIASNHASYYDFFVLTYAILQKRPNETIYFLATHELLKNPLLNFFIRHGITACIPIDRTKPGIAYFKQSLSVLGEGRVLVVFPEGTRSLNGEIGEWKPGVIRLSLSAKAPIVPIALKGTFNILPKGRIIPSLNKCSINIGKPMHFFEASGKRVTADQVSDMGDRLMFEIMKLKGQE